MSEPAYETKSVRFHLPERGQYLYMMITRFDGEQNILGDIGYGGTYFQFQTISANELMQCSSTDPFALARHHPWELRDLYPFDLLYQLDTGGVPWDAIKDGEYLTESDVDSVIEENQ